MLTQEQKKEKRSWFVFIVGYFIGGYLLLNWINQYQSHYYDVSVRFEYSIPFIPEFIFGYILVYFSALFLYFIIDDIADFRRTVVAYLLTTTIYYTLFLIFPVRCNLRPDLSNASGFSIDVTKFYYIIDKPYNLFPSLHVAYPTLATLLSWRHHRYASLALVMMTIIIILSVIFVKQHYISDVVVGAGVATILYRLVVLTERHWSKLFTPSNALRELSQRRSQL